MYVGDHAILHIGTTRTPATRGKSDSFDHVAFRAAGLDEIRTRLREQKIYFEGFSVPARNLHQVFFRDPDGNEIELLFSGEEAPQPARKSIPRWAAESSDE
jgi:catechol 2,3-dioxygenase-like lactoylglutathione lyase family enzyme